MMQDEKKKAETVEETVTKEPSEEITSKESSEEKVPEPKPKKKPKKPTDKERIKKLEEEMNALNDQLLRNHAELQNFKRRTNEERIKDRKYANLELVKNLLTPLDNFERGLKSEEQSKDVRLQGLAMVYRDLISVLKEDGLKEIDPLEEVFDPNFHQAVAKESVQDMDSNIVIEVYQKGYSYKDRVIRPAMVKVSE